MRSRPDYISLTNDHVAVRVEVAVPWLNESMCYQHAFDHPGLREEFGPLPEILDPFELHRRREIMERRAKSVDAIAHTIARSILDAMGRTKP